MPLGIRALLILLALRAAWFLWQWVAIEKRRQVPTRAPGTVSPWDVLIGFVTNFFDALGIGNFASRG